MRPFKNISVVPNIPERITFLRELSLNFWTVWNPEAERLFSEMNKSLWLKVGRNPVKFLKNVSQKRLDQAAESEEYLKLYDDVVEKCGIYKELKKSWYGKNYANKEELNDLQIAYFSAEFGIHESFPIYSGGLGILAGDHIKSSSDLDIPLIAVGLLYKNGYFEQKITKEGSQQVIYNSYSFSDFPVTPAKNDFGEEIKISVDLPEGTLMAKVWIADVMNTRILFLDTDISENPPEFRVITSQLYGGDNEMRIKQEMLLGIGGVRALRRVGFTPTVWHMNEGHSVFMALERIRELVESKKVNFIQALEAVRASTVFTTHTPVPAGNDAFHHSLISKYFGKFWRRLGISEKEFLDLGRADIDKTSQMFNLTILALKAATWKNGVSKLHGEVSRSMWNDVWYSIPSVEIPIRHITNGIHVESWLHEEMRKLYDKYLPEWKDNLLNLNYWNKIDEIPNEELWTTLKKMKGNMIDFVHNRVIDQRRRHGETIEQLREIENIFDSDTLTIGFARRFATYKRATLIFRNMERLKSIINNPERPVQIIFAGKAHPADKPGQELIKKIYEISRMPDFANRIVILENYDMEVGRNLVSGVDIWLNTPRRPHEASGTSGQKVPVNGGINFSVLDGWWVEGYNKHNGWVIGDSREYDNTEIQDNVDSVSFYDTLEKEVIPAYYSRQGKDYPERFLGIVKESIKSNVPVFNTHRMVKDYLEKLYIPAFEYGKKLGNDDYKKAMQLAEWKKKVRTEWDSVRINSNSKREDGEEIPVNYKVDFSATVYLGDISPEDVSVEVYFARYNINDEMENYEVFPLEMERETLHNTYIFKGTVQLEERGRYEYSMRVVPKDSDLPQQHDLGLVRWIEL